MFKKKENKANIENEEIAEASENDLEAKEENECNPFIKRKIQKLKKR